MPRKIFVNLPIADMQRSQAFWRAMGFSFNPQFTNEQGACMVVSDDIFVMLLVQPFFQTFTDKTIADARKTCEVLLALDCDSRAAVDEMVRKAVAAGGTTPRPPQDHGFMYQHAFDDPDGHSWEVFWMQT
jgi:predicted lactoylglutathione lyase